MPLLDHFRPPLSQRRHWDSFHGAWAEAIALELNQSLLPAHYVAEARVHLGGLLEIDVGTFAENVRLPSSGEGGVALWAPPRPTAIAALDPDDQDRFEVQILNDEEGPCVVAAIELVSPANKDRPSHRHAFAIKCAGYVYSGCGLMVVDDVTERSGNLHRELLELLKVDEKTAASGPKDLYATAYRRVLQPEKPHLEMWAEVLSVGATLPTLPLWIQPALAVPVDLEATYRQACVARRID